MGVYPITKTYAARHGYSVNIFPARGLVELRASYFSCHTYNKVATCTFPVVCTHKRSLWVGNALFQKDEVFRFNFNLIVSDGGELKTHSMNKTCTPALPWVQKEITCEVNYMEVMMRLPAIGNMYSGLSRTMLFSP